MADPDVKYKAMGSVKAESPLTNVCLVPDESHDQSHDPGMVDMSTRAEHVTLTLDPPGKLKTWSWTSMILATLSSVCCFCGLCGIPAFILSMMSYADHKVHDYGAARLKKRLSTRLSLLGMLLGVVFITLLLLFIYGLIYKLDVLSAIYAESLRPPSRKADGSPDQLPLGSDDDYYGYDDDYFDDYSGLPDDYFGTYK